MTKTIGAAVALGVLLLAACGYPVKESGPPAKLRALSSVSSLADQFNRDAGATRLILLLSPT